MERGPLHVRQARCALALCYVAYDACSSRLWSPPCPYVAAFVNNAHVVVPAIHSILVALHGVTVSKLGNAPPGGNTDLDTVEGWEGIFLKCASFNVLRLQQNESPTKKMPWEQVFCLEQVLAWVRTPWHPAV